MHGQKKH